MPSGPNNLGDYLKSKASQYDLGRQDQLVFTQDLLDQRYPKKTRAISFNDGVLTILTPSSAVASELNYAQVKLKADLLSVLPELKNIVVKIRSL